MNIHCIRSPKEERPQACDSRCSAAARWGILAFWWFLLYLPTSSASPVKVDCQCHASEARSNQIYDHITIVAYAKPDGRTSQLREIESRQVREDWTADFTQARGDVVLRWNIVSSDKWILWPTESQTSIQENAAPVFQLTTYGDLHMKIGVSAVQAIRMHRDFELALLELDNLESIDRIAPTEQLEDVEVPKLLSDNSFVPNLLDTVIYSLINATEDCRTDPNSNAQVPARICEENLWMRSIGYSELAVSKGAQALSLADASQRQACRDRLKIAYKHFVRSVHGWLDFTLTAYLRPRKIRVQEAAPATYDHVGLSNAYHDANCQKSFRGDLATVILAFQQRDVRAYAEETLKVHSHHPIPAGIRAIKDLWARIIDIDINPQDSAALDGLAIADVENLIDGIYQLEYPRKWPLFGLN